MHEHLLKCKPIRWKLIAETWTSSELIITKPSRCLESIHKNMSAITLPFLILHGENDSLCQPAGSHLLAREAKAKDKKLKIYPGASHHLILEVISIKILWSSYSYESRYLSLFKSSIIFLLDKILFTFPGEESARRSNFRYYQLDSSEIEPTANKKG